MPQPEEQRPQDVTALRPADLAAEHAAELPDREAMSLITGPGGAGPLPMLVPPTIDPASADPAVLPTDGAAPLPPAQNMG